MLRTHQVNSKAPAESLNGAKCVLCQTELTSYRDTDDAFATAKAGSFLNVSKLRLVSKPEK